jgi:hypothetical protein
MMQRYKKISIWELYLNRILSIVANDSSMNCCPTGYDSAAIFGFFIFLQFLIRLRLLGNNLCCMLGVGVLLII